MDIEWLKNNPNELLTKMLNDQSYLIQIDDDTFIKLQQYSYGLLSFPGNGYRICQDCNLFLSRHFADIHEKMEKKSDNKTHKVLSRINVIGK
jgi:hypothetical protein